MYGGRLMIIYSVCVCACVCVCVLKGQCVGIVYSSAAV